MDISDQRRKHSTVVLDSLLTTIAEARMFVAVQPSVAHGPTVHWLDQGSSRLAAHGSIEQLQQLWAAAQADAVHRGGGDVDPVDWEASRLFRLALAMAIVAKAGPPLPLPVEP
jgi:hypothetical protein